jgi:uncharacterized phage-associated protein
METGYSPFKVARFFIEKAAQTGQKLTPMKLIKLVYIAHGWHLALRKSPLISEKVQAWKYGPVIESLYHGFKHLGNSNIEKGEAICLPQNDMDSETNALLEKVWAKYGGLAGTHLSALTHLGNTPWDIVWNQQGGKEQKCAEIPDTLIQEFYQKKIEVKGSGH